MFNFKLYQIFTAIDIVILVFTIFIGYVVFGELFDVHLTILFIIFFIVSKIDNRLKTNGE